MKLPGLLLLGTMWGCGIGKGDDPSPKPMDPLAYVTIEQGSLPIVLSAPHGGESILPGIPERILGTTTLDTATYALAMEIQARIHEKLAKKAHVVAALVSRKYVDFNREEGQAYEHPAVAPLYRAYHEALGKAVETSRISSGGLLVDIHGQSSSIGVVFRGTRNGLTADLNRLHRRPGGLLSELIGKGILLSPDGPVGPEHASYNGGYIVASYGAHQPKGIQAVQLEYGFSYRQDAECLRQTAMKTAEALVAHLENLASTSFK